MKNVRIQFKKKGNLKFISHLDMNRLFLRLVKKAGLPIWHTEGFNPHPYVTFAVPLSLGFESEYDIFDIKLTDDNYDTRLVADAFRAVAPDGLEFIESFEPQMKYGDIYSADFVITFFDVDSIFSNRLAEFCQSKPINVQKKRKNGKIDTIDISEKILSVNVENTADGVVLRLSLPAGSNENVNPTLFISAFIENYPEYDKVCKSIVRTMIYNKDGKVFR